MTTTFQKFGLAMIAAAGLAIGTAGAANADWDHGRHRGWEQGRHHGWHNRGWRGHFAYGGDCFVRRTVHINRFGERVIRRVRICN